MLQPTPEQLASLSAKDRFWLRVALVFNGPLKWYSVATRATYGTWLMWLTGGRRYRYHGLEHIEGYDRKTSLVIAANHRSFFDFYTIAHATNHYSRLTRRCFYPVRSTFFYEGFLGAFLNFAITGMAMFPPIMRDARKGALNRWALDRLAAELARPGTMVGMHPEGRRNKNPDPFALLPAQPGIGRLAVKVEDLLIVPIFVKGMSNRALHETWWNWTCPRDKPIDIRFGPPVTYADLVDPDNPQASARAISKRVMEAVGTLAQAQAAWEASEEEAAWPAQPVRVRSVIPRLRELSSK